MEKSAGLLAPYKTWDCQRLVNCLFKLPSRNPSGSFGYHQMLLLVVHEVAATVMVVVQ